MAEVIDTVVVGAGHVGLAISCLLTRNGTDHVVLERGQFAQRWRSERWDSLVFQFPNWSLQLPDYAYRGPDPDGYASKDNLFGSWRNMPRPFVRRCAAIPRYSPEMLTTAGSWTLIPREALFVLRKPTFRGKAQRRRSVD
jgi:choline dehydrogenase-like flavoprotein